MEVYILNVPRTELYSRVYITQRVPDLRGHSTSLRKIIYYRSQQIDLKHIPHHNIPSTKLLRNKEALTTNRSFPCGRKYLTEKEYILEKLRNIVPFSECLHLQTNI